VQADLTVTFIGLKLGLFTGDAADVVGELVFNDLHADPHLLEGAPISCPSPVSRQSAASGLPRTRFP
jgi:hypothetical protein